jgi:hypothetical protein
LAETAAKSQRPRASERGLKSERPPSSSHTLRSTMSLFSGSRQLHATNASIHHRKPKPISSIASQLKFADVSVQQQQTRTRCQHSSLSSNRDLSDVSIQQPSRTHLLFFYYQVLYFYLSKTNFEVSILNKRGRSPFACRDLIL